MIKKILIALTLTLSSCAVKTLVKNCNKVETNDYYVCDMVFYK